MLHFREHLRLLASVNLTAFTLMVSSAAWMRLEASEAVNGRQRRHTDKISVNISAI